MLSYITKMKSALEEPNKPKYGRGDEFGMMYVKRGSYGGVSSTQGFNHLNPYRYMASPENYVHQPRPAV